MENHKEKDRRTGERRKQNAPVPANRRKSTRRKNDYDSIDFGELATSNRGNDPANRIGDVDIYIN